MLKENEGPPYRKAEGGDPSVSSASVEDLTRKLLALQGEGSLVSGIKPLEGNGVPNSDPVEGGYVEREDGVEKERYTEQERWIEAWRDFTETHDNLDNLFSAEMMDMLLQEYPPGAHTLAEIRRAQGVIQALRDLGGDDLTPEKLENNEEYAQTLEQFYQDYTTLWSREVIRTQMLEEEAVRAAHGILDPLKGFPADRPEAGPLAHLLKERYAKTPAWLTQGIDAVRYETVPEGEIGERTPKKYVRGDGPGDTELVVRMSATASAEDIARTVSREVAHRNNWDNAPTLTLEERARFLAEVTHLRKELVATTPRMDEDTPYAEKDTATYRLYEEEAYWQTLNELYDESPNNALTHEEKKCVQKWREYILLDHAQQGPGAEGDVGTAEAVETPPVE